MLNQISKLKGNEIFSLVTPEGMDQYIVSRDLIGNVLNVVEDILRKREQPPQVVPISEDCEDAKRLAKDACNKATIAHLNSKDALEKTKNILDILNEVRYKSTTALNKATHAEIVSKAVQFLSQDVNTLKSQVNNMVGDINNLNTNMVTTTYLNEIVGELNQSRLSDLNRVNQQLSNLVSTQNQQADTLSAMASEIESIKAVLSGLEEISPEDIVNLTQKVNQLTEKERKDIFNVNSRIDQLEDTVEQLEENTKVDSTLSETSVNPVQNKVITKTILENEEITSAALNDLDQRVKGLEQINLSNEIPYYIITYLDSIGDGLEKIDLIPKNSRFYLSKGGSSVDSNTLTDIKMNGISIKNDSQYVTSDGYGFTIDIPHVTGSLVIDYHYEFISQPNPNIDFPMDDEDEP